MLPDGASAIPEGLLNPVIVSTTELDAVEITETVFELKLETYTNLLFGFTDTPIGSCPVFIVITENVSVFITNKPLER
jgi:hypothetical protein